GSALERMPRTWRSTTLVLLALAALVSIAGCGPLPTSQSPAPPPQAQPEAVPVPPVTPVPVPAAPPVPIHIDSEPDLDIGLAWDLDVTRIGFDGTQSLEVQSIDRPGVHSTAGPVEFRASGNQLLVTPKDHERAVPLMVLHAGDTLWLGPPDWGKGGPAREPWDGTHW